MSGGLDRNVFWVPWRGAGMEHLWVRSDEGGFDADGLLLDYPESFRRVFPI